MMLAVPSWKPIRFLGRAWLKLFAVRPNPASSHLGCAIEIPCLIRSCTAWKATWGSLAQTWMARSPPLIERWIWSPWNFGRSTSGAGRCRASPNRSCLAVPNSEGPNPNVTVSSLGPWPTASPVSTGGLVPVCIEPIASPRDMRAAASVQVFSSWRRSATDLPTTSRAANWR